MNRKPRIKTSHAKVPKAKKAKQVCEIHNLAPDSDVIVVYVGVYKITIAKPLEHDREYVTVRVQDLMEDSEQLTVLGQEEGITHIKL